MTLPHVETPVVLQWFRRDLRWQDNRALHAALNSGHPVVPVFVFDPNILGKLESASDARVTFLHDRLQMLRSHAQDHGGDIFVIHGTVEVMSSLVENTNVKAIYTNEDYEPYAQRRDERVHEVLGRLGKPLHTFTDHVIQAPGEVVKPDGSPYTVFTPYSKRWHANLTEENMAQAPSELHLDALHTWTAPDLPSLAEMGFVRSTIATPEANLLPTS